MKSWTKPTPEQVDRVVGKLGRPGAYRYFFANLQNPEWVEPLRARGFFSSPPPVVRDDANGEVRIPDWPEADYLGRVAAEVPELVADIVLKVPATTNYRVHQSLTNVALQLPANLAARLINQAVTWMPSAPFRTLSMCLPHLVVHLAESGQSKEAFRLAAEVFAFERAADDESSSASLDKPLRAAIPRTRMDLWEYNEGLKVCGRALGRANPLRAIHLVGGLLEEALRGSDLIRTGERELDVSHMRAQDLDAPDESFPTSFEGLLARTLSRLTIDVLRDGQVDVHKVLYAVEKRRWVLFKAIALYALAQVAPLGASAAKAKILDRSLFESGECRDQYARLVQGRFSELSADERQTVIGWIDDGPNLESRARNYEWFYGRSPTAEELEQSHRVWTRDRLLWLGATNLPPDKAEQLQQLLTALGMPEQEPFGKAFWWGPSSPISDEDLAAMPLPALVDFLRSWVSSGEEQPSRTGLARQLQAAAKGRPNEFATAAETFIGLAPIYVHHLIWGLDEAARLGASFDVCAVLSLCVWMVRQPRGEEPSIPFVLRADEVSWEGARRACASFMGTLLERGLPSPAARTSIWSVIRQLTEDPDPSPQDESERGSSFEATTMSLNCTRGQAMHAALKYGRWLWQAWEKEENQREHTFDHLPEVREVLDRHLDPLVENTLTVRSIYGQYFPLLTYFDASWAGQAVEKIFPGDAPTLWWGAWIPYLQFGGAYDNVFKLLQRQYSVSIEQLPARAVKEKREGWVEHLGSHLMVFYWRGLIGLGDDDLLGRFMERATPPMRKQALDFIGRSLLNSPGTVPEEVLARLMALWESRMRTARSAADREACGIELSSFGTWFLSGKFSDDWSIDQLHEVTGLVEGDIISAFPVIKRLVELAPRIPERSVEILDRLLFGPKRNWLYVGSMAEVGEVLGSALASDAPAAHQIAIRVIDKLAERGDMTYRGLFSTGRSL
jgi:hypothetical protein